MSPTSMPDPAFAKDGPVTKFQFTDVDIDDEFQDLVIYAGSRDHKNDKQDHTNCNYFTAGGVDYLGQYEEAVGFGPDQADAVLAFCVENFGDRQ